MSAQELRQSIHELVEKVPEDYLRTVKTYLAELSSGEVIPELGCTIEEYNRELEKGDAAIRRGEYYTQEEVFDYIDKRMAKYWNEAEVEQARKRKAR